MLLSAPRLSTLAHDDTAATFTMLIQELAEREIRVQELIASRLVAAEAAGELQPSEMVCATPVHPPCHAHAV